MSTLRWVKETLSSAGAPFRELHHRPAFTAQEIAEAEHISGRQVAKTVAVEIDNAILLLVLPACRRVSLEKVRRLAPSLCARLLSEDEAAFFFSDCEVGAIPPLRHWPGIDIWMDPSLKITKDISFSGGARGDAVCVPFETWRKIAQPREMDFSQSLQAEAPSEDEEDDWRDH